MSGCKSVVMWLRTKRSKFFFFLFSACCNKNGSAAGSGEDFRSSENNGGGSEPLFDLVTVKSTEKTPYSDVTLRGRNPLGIKALMSIPGMPSGGCRQPMGKLTKNALEKVLSASRNVQTKNPEIFKPVAEFFKVNIDGRLENPSSWKGLCYEFY